MPQTLSLANPEKRSARGSHLRFRVGAHTNKPVERAAALERRSLTDYCLTVLTQATQATITRHESIVLAEANRELFFDALVHPPKPNPRLKRAFRSAQRAGRRTSVRIQCNAGEVCAGVFGEFDQRRAVTDAASMAAYGADGTSSDRIFSASSVGRG